MKVEKGETKKRLTWVSRVIMNAKVNETLN